MTHLLALDQGTSSSRSILFDAQAQTVASAQKETKQLFPRPGWVEHDPIDIWRTQLETARATIEKATSAQAITAIGITNQRETTLLWHRDTGEPLCNAIVWQDRRTEPLCEQLRSEGLEPLILERTGLRIDPYFSATKLRWMLDHVTDARKLAQQGKLAFGTVDSWLIWHLTEGAVHATDITNASRTMLFNVHDNRWDAELMRALNIPDGLMPRALPSSSLFGSTAKSLFGRSLPICGVAGDQQAALFGQACFNEGMAKNTYGTGCFALMHTGNRFQISKNGLITTPTAQSGANLNQFHPSRSPQEPSQYFALEGSVFVGGAVVQWMRDGLRAVNTSHEIEQLARSVPDSGGVVVVPAFTGLGAPYWKPEARGSITGLTRGSTMAHIARAALESIAFQSAALLQAMDRDAIEAGASPLAQVRVDGGAAANDLLMQFQADLLGIPVVRPKIIETTALGAALLAGLGSSVFPDLDSISRLWRADKTFTPTMDRAKAGAHMQRWEHAVHQTSLTPDNETAPFNHN